MVIPADLAAVADQKITVNARAGYLERASRWTTYLAGDVEFSGDPSSGFKLDLPGLRSDDPDAPGHVGPQRTRRPKPKRSHTIS